MAGSTLVSRFFLQVKSADTMQAYHGTISGINELEGKFELLSQHLCLCGLVVRVLGYRSGGSGLIPGTTRFSEK
jgi:hypothetical protein